MFSRSFELTRYWFIAVNSRASALLRISITLGSPCIVCNPPLLVGAVRFYFSLNGKPHNSRARHAMRIDSHVHTYRSGDSRSPLSLVLRAAHKAGIDVLCITDHGTIDGALEAIEKASETSTPWKGGIVIGQECRTWAGEIIGLFLYERIPGNLHPHEVVARIREQAGLVYIPHPFCRQHNGLQMEVLEELVAEGMVDIVEVHNAKAQPCANERALSFAVNHGLIGVAASDAHYPEFVGRAFVETETFEGITPERIASDPTQFLRALSTGHLYKGTYSYAEAKWPKRV
ncbi:MAG: hypothetical protein C4318_03485 [Acidimicrobiia bacterium]